MQINILEYFQYKQGVAVIDGDMKVTFDELKQKVFSLASHLCTLGYRNKPIAVYLPKSIDCIIADLAIIYSGNIYMNLDVKLPISRLENIINQIQPVLIIKSGDCQLKGQKLSIDKFVFGRERHDLLSKIRDSHIDTDPLCIINTSGSTGTPKGVVLNHRSFIDFCEWSKSTFNIGGNEIIGSLSPTVFDIFSYELCLLMQGSTLVLIPDSFTKFPVDILDLLVKHKVSFIFWVPTIMVNIANMDLLAGKVSFLENVWFAGEVFPTKQFNYWRNHLPEVQFVNLYGPIEITLDCTYFVVDREFQDNEPLPIGIPCKNTDILILDENNEPSDEGELCVRGTSLAMGYYNNPEKTAEVFVQNPLNNSYPELIYRTGDYVSKNERGELMFKGRRDTLIKHSGYRIELTEIEHVINSLGIEGAVCYDYKTKELVLFHIINFDTNLIRIFLPKYMMPTKYILLSELPMNTNGKIDRLKLNEMIND